MADNRILIELSVDLPLDWELFGILRRCNAGQKIVDQYARRLSPGLNYVDDWLVCRACEVLHHFEDERCGRFSTGFVGRVRAEVYQENRYLACDLIQLDNLKAFFLSIEAPDFWELKMSTKYSDGSGGIYLWVHQRERPEMHGI